MNETKITTNNWNEAQEDARRLTKVTGRDVFANPTPCDCDYSKDCGKCGGEGTVYTQTYDSCDHSVQDGPDLECEENDCANKERLAEIKRLEVNDERAA